MKKWMAILGVLVALLGASLGAGCGNERQDDRRVRRGHRAPTVSQPQNETTVYAADLEVKGKTEADAVVA